MNGPMLATKGRVFDDPAWLYEIKYDGWRMLVTRNGQHVSLTSRQGTDLTGRFPRIVAAALSTPTDRYTIDCEVVSLDSDGVPRLTALLESSQPTTLVAFDLLRIGDEDATGYELLERKRALKVLLEGSHVLYARHVLGEGRAMFDLAVSKGHEGVMAKRCASRYQAGRTRDWLKLKPRYEA